MSERAFRIVLVTVFVIWVAFVLVPSGLDNAPRMWWALQYWLPGSNPLVQVTVKQAGPNAPVADARVQIVMDGLTVTGFTDKNGTVAFADVPAGRTKQIRVQKTDYDIGLINDPVIPHRQRARFQVDVLQDDNRRLYIGHEAGGGAVSITLFDAASRQPLSPPGPSGAWENVPAFDIVANLASQRVYALSADRLTVISMTGRGVIRELVLASPASGMAVSPNGDTVYIVVNTSGRLRMLLGLDAGTFAPRFQTQIDAGTAKAIVIASPDGSRVYVANVGGLTVGGYSARGTGRVATYQIGEAVKDIALSDDGRTLYALTEHRLVALRIDEPAAQRTEVLGLGEAVSVPAATRILFAAHHYEEWLCLLQPGLGQVTLINLAVGGTKVYTVALGQDPSDIAHIHDGDEIYVANRADSSLSVVSLSGHKLLDSIEVRSRPVMLAPQ